MSKQFQLTASESQVVEYLSNHPSFFQEHLDVLEKMYVPHPTGEAISLIAKQLELFRVKHQEQEKQLTALIAIAKENDISLKRMHQLTLALLEADTIDKLLSNLHIVLAEYFLTDFVSVKIISKQTDQRLGKLIVAPDDEGLKHFSYELLSHQPTCGQLTRSQAKFLFAELSMQVKSCAIIPMVYTRIEGLIGIGSLDQDRFQQGMGNLFLMKISELIATRLISLLDENL